MKVLPDTNVWLSALVFSGLCAELVAGLFESGHTVMSSELVRAEVLDVFERKFSRHTLALDGFESLWSQTLAVTDVDTPVDDADARLVAAASAAGADCFVTGDQRVLGWEHASTMRILSPRKAWRAFFDPYAS